MRGLAAIVMLVGCFAAGAWAQDPTATSADPCGECRKGADSDRQKCEGIANDGAAREACAKRAAEASLTCQLSVCKAGPKERQTSGTCPGCQHRVAEEERSCRTMPPGSPEQLSCTQRAGRLRTECDQTVCRPTAPK